MENNVHDRKPLSPGKAIAFLLIVIATIIGVIRSGIAGPNVGPVAVFCGAAASMFLALLLRCKSDDIYHEFENSIKSCSVPFIVMFTVGVMVGVWLIGGTLPSVIYYGTMIITPSALVPCSFLLCALMSVCTGSSLGSLGTMGLALYSIGANMDINTALLIGAIVSGSVLGDKMSPLSDTTNVAPAMSGTDLWSHIGSMMYTTLPASAICFVLYVILGHQAAADADISTIGLVQETLAANFNISVVCLLPFLLVVTLSFLRINAMLTLIVSAVFSIVLALLTQDVSLSAILTTAVTGYKADTGVALIDGILSRGGAASMGSTISMVVYACLMAGSMKVAGVLDALVDVLGRIIKNRPTLVISNLVYSYIIVAATGNQMLGIVIPGQTMQGSYDEQNVHRKVLSRSLEDAATIGASIIPWSTMCGYIYGALGCGPEFIPYTFLPFLVPVFSLICAFTGFGVWDWEGNPVWKKKK